MLQKLNERIQGLVAWVIVGLVALTFTLFGLEHYMQSRRDNVAQVEVNGFPVSKQAFEINYRRIRQMRAPQLSAAAENQLKQQVLDQLILNQVSVDAANKNGFFLSKAQANAAILHIPQFQEKGRFSELRYSQAISGALFTPRSFQTEVRQGMLLNQQRFAFIGTSFALPNEIQKFVKLYMQTRDYRYLKIPASLFGQQVKITDDEIEKYYVLHKSEFFSPEKVSIEYIRLSMQDIKKNIKVTNEEIKRYYEDNQGQPGMSRPLQEVKADIEAQLMADLAQTEYARVLDKLSELSFQTPDTLAPIAEDLKLSLHQTEPFSRFGGDEEITKKKPIIQAAFTHDILDLGNNSEPIQLDNDSVIVLRLHKRIPTTEKSLAEVKPLITETLTWKKAEILATEAGQAQLKQPGVPNTMLVNLTWQAVKKAGRDGDEAPVAINELAFSLPHAGAQQGRLIGRDFVIVELNAVQDGNVDALDKEQLASVTQQIEAGFGVMDYDLYVKGELKKAVIVRH
jgi:peptidyl-prolyl cis-trans isomerase D